MSSTHLALLAVDAYIVTSKDVYDVRQQYKTHPFDHLHPYCINHNEGAGSVMTEAANYLQFMGTFGDDDYPNQILFDLSTHDDLLFEEVSNVGYEDLFEGIDFKKIMNNFPIGMYNERGRWLGAPFYLIVELTYMSSYDHYSGATEYDLFVDIVGYLDANLDKNMFDVLKIGE